MEPEKRHQCMIYRRSPLPHLRGVANVAAQKLHENRRCLILHSPEMIGQMRWLLAKSGVWVEHEIRKGRLILSSETEHIVEGRFESEILLEGLRRAVRQALQDGYDGLWATGDMAWEFGDEKNFSRLLEYEHALQRLFDEEPALSGICQYRAETLPANAIHWGLCSHRAIFINEKVSEQNPYYEPNGLLRQISRPLAPSAIRNFMAAPLEPSAIA